MTAPGVGKEAAGNDRISTGRCSSGRPAVGKFYSGQLSGHLVNCLGIGTRTKAFQDPLDAWRTGVSLTAVMTLTALLSWLLDQLLQHFALGYFQTLVFALVGPAVVAGLRYFLKNCVPELSRRMDENLASITSNCAAMGAALLIAQRGYSAAQG